MPKRHLLHFGRGAKGRDLDESRAARALQLVQLGELYSTLTALSSHQASRRHSVSCATRHTGLDVLRDPIPDIMNITPREFELDEILS